MPAKPPAKGKGGGLTRKVGPLPLWAWLAIGAGVGFFLLKRIGGQSAATQTTQAGQPAVDAQGSTGLVPSGGGGTVDTGAASGTDIASALGQQQSLIQSLATQLQSTQSQLDLLASTPPPQLAAAGYSIPDSGQSGLATSSMPGGSNSPLYFRVSAYQQHFAQAAQARDRNLAYYGKQLPFGGVVSVQRLRNGGQVTLYRSGRKVEQLPGRSAYVIHR